MATSPRQATNGHAQWRRPLRRANLRGADLQGADLHQADLRGVDLSGADLRGADLRGARTGLGPRALVVDLVLASAAAGAAGFVASWMGAFIAKANHSADPSTHGAGLILSSELALCLLAILWRGTWFAIRHVALPTMVLLVVMAIQLALLEGKTHAALLALSVVGLSFLFGAMMTTVALARAVASASHVLPVVVLVAGAWFAGAAAEHGRLLAVTVAVVATVAAARAKAGSSSSPRLSRWLKRIATRGGTSFRNADLRGARVTDALFRNADFRGARCDGIDWDASSEIGVCSFDEGGDAPPAKPLRRARRH
jgi:uncharacterized protein YjbI with pentapeptide repeats